jgi:hypothetical protein
MGVIGRFLLNGEVARVRCGDVMLKVYSAWAFHPLRTVLLLGYVILRHPLRLLKFLLVVGLVLWFLTLTSAMVRGCVALGVALARLVSP